MSSIEFPVYKNYSRAQLDQEYDNVKKVKDFDFQAYLSHLNTANVLARQQYEEYFSADMQYGARPDETLDLFLINPGGPLHVFFHGGYWRMLHKNDFSYVANGVLPHGHNLAVINYSLIPSVRMGELVRQCFSSIDWLMQNGEDLGFDPTQIRVSGHSAGGHLAVMMATQSFRYKLQSICGMSGIFNLTPIQRCFLNDVLDLTDAEVLQNSPVFLQPILEGDLRLVTGKNEGVEYESQVKELEKKWINYGVVPEVIFAHEKDHFSLRADLNDPSSAVIQSVLFL